MQNKIHEHIEKHGGYWEPMMILGRLAEETGEVAKVVNTSFGEKKSRDPEKESKLAEELADVPIALTALANSQNINLEKAFKEKIQQDNLRNKGFYFTEEEK